MCCDVRRPLARRYVEITFGKSHKDKAVKILEYLYAIGVTHRGNRLTDLGVMLRVEMWEDFELWFYGRDRKKEKREKALASSPSPDLHTAPHI